MSWDVIRSIGLIMFVCGSIVLFAVKLGQYFDPPQPDAWIRLIAESWMRSGGDGLMVAGACLALLGIAVGYLTVTTDPQMAGVLGATEQGVKEKLIPTITVQGLGGVGKTCAWAAVAEWALQNIGAAEYRHSTLILAARMTLLHFSASVAMNFPKSAGEPASTVAPKSASRAFISGSARATFISLFRLSTISGGVFLGRQPRTNYWPRSPVETH